MVAVRSFFISLTFSKAYLTVLKPSTSVKYDDETPKYSLFFLTYEFGPLRWRPEQGILLWKRLWAPVTCKDQDVGSGTPGRAARFVEGSQRPGKR